MLQRGKILTNDELQAMINEVDIDGKEGSECIHFAEFLNVMATRLKVTDCDGGLKEAFRAVDKDQKGFLTAEDLHRVLTSLGEKLTEDAIDEIIEEVESKRDGLINYEDLVNFMKDIFL